MGQRIDARAISAGDTFYYSDAFKTFVETHLTFLRDHPTTEQLVIEPETAHLYQYDLNMFLLSRGVRFNEHYLIMRVNNMSGAHQFTPETTRLLIPNEAIVAELVRLFRTSIGSAT